MTPWQETRALLKLAAPLIAGFVGNQMMSFVDTAMVGRLGPAAIAGTGIGAGVYFMLSIVAMGCALGADPLIAQAVGAGEHARARRVYWQALRVGGWMCLPVMVLILLVPLALPPIGVTPEVVGATRDYLWGRVWNALPLALFAASRSYLQATSSAIAVVISTLVANLSNFLLDALLIYGDASLSWVGLPGIGLPALGTFGAGLASSLTSLLATAVLFRAVSAVPAPPDPARRAADPALMRRIFRLGLPIGLQMFVEVSAFAGASVMSGTISTVAAAGNQIALQLASLSFMVPLGLATATAVRVGKAVGRGDSPRGVRRAGSAGFACGASFMSFAALLFILFPAPLARTLTDQPAVIAAAVPLIQVAAMFQLFDGMQVVGAGALRGAGDTHHALLANLVGYYVIGLPLAAALVWGVGTGGVGLWWGLNAGLIVIGSWLITRFYRVAARPIARS
jgi:MATE family multidrug resistance protein